MKFINEIAPEEKLPSMIEVSNFERLGRTDCSAAVALGTVTEIVRN
jgi:hypothetical protein